MNEFFSKKTVSPGSVLRQHVFMLVYSSLLILDFKKPYCTTLENPSNYFLWEFGATNNPYLPKNSIIYKIIKFIKNK